jgi:hypothetical protein
MDVGLTAMENGSVGCLPILDAVKCKLCFNPDKGDVLLGREHRARRPKLPPPFDHPLDGPYLLDQILPELVSGASRWLLSLLLCFSDFSSESR